MKKVFFMITTALVLIGLLVVPACNDVDVPDPDDPEYNLTMTVSPAGSGTTTPTGTTQHAEGDVVNISATPSAGYLFDNWEASVGSAANPDEASTTYTMPGEAVTLTANFKEVPSITFAVTGPMTFIQGKDHWEGAQKAQEEINDAGGVNVGGVTHMVDLVQVETNEILDVTGADGTSALTAVIDDVDFVVGGFRTESLFVYREVAVGPDGAGKIFMNCGAATAALQASVVQDYENYKYFFKVTPYNEVFLATSTLKYTGIVHSVMRQTLAAVRDVDEGDIEPLRFGLMMEDAEWSNPMELPVVGTLTQLGLEHIGTQKCTSFETDLEAQLSALAAGDPHIVFTILSGPPGKAYGLQQSEFLPNAFSLGINVEAQDIDYHADTGADYHMTLDTWAELVEVTPIALDWFNAMVAKTGRYPTYCAASYDAVHTLVEGVEAVSAANGWDSIADVVDHGNIDELIQYLETSVRVGVGAKAAYYPMPGGMLPGDIPYLTFEQVSPLYPHLVESDPGPGEFQYDPADFTLEGGFIAHDTVYGPGWQTGIGAQWQEIDGTWKKVAVWPMYLGEVGDLLVDKFGDWNFQYPGTQSLIIPDSWIAAHASP